MSSFIMSVTDSALTTMTYNKTRRNVIAILNYPKKQVTPMTIANEAFQ